MRATRYGALLVPVAVFLETIGSRAPAAATEAVTIELAHCAAMASGDARLACYDSLAGRSSTGAARPAERAAAPVVPVAVVPAAAAPAAMVPATAAPVVTANTAAMPVTAPPTMPAPPADPDAAARNFGLSAAQLHSPPQGPQSIQAHVAHVTVDQLRRDYVVLDNGQTWASTEGELLLYTGELVTIGHGALGSFMLVSTASKHSYHVRRVR